MNWEEFDRGVFLVNILGVVYDSKKKKILIGRREHDPYVKELGWGFPSGRPTYSESIESCLKGQVKIKTGLEVEIQKILFSKIAPEKREFLLIYYQCKPVGGKEQAGEKFVELKWIKTNEVKKYIATSLDPRLEKFLKTLK